MICGLVLAGGRSRRFGSEKAMALLDGRPMIDAAVAYLKASCDLVAVGAPAESAAGEWAQAQGLDRLTDDPALPQGPLTGVLAGLRWAAARAADRLATIPCDTPRLPAGLIERLSASLDTGHAAAVARTADGLHPLCGVWRADLGDVFARAMASGDHPPVREVLGLLKAEAVWFEDADAFLNVNTAQDLLAVKGRPKRRP